MLILGVTGGIATGKSTVIRAFADLGAKTLSADDVARELLAPGTDCTRAVLEAFPGAALMGGGMYVIDRAALAAEIFANDNSRRTLNGIMHPRIRAIISEQTDRWRRQADPPAAAIEIPLLIESGGAYRLDRIIVVSCSEATQVSRIRSVFSVDEEEARRRIAAQAPLAEKVSRADFVIDTDRSLADTKAQVATIWQNLGGTG